MYQVFPFKVQKKYDPARFVYKPKNLEQLKGRLAYDFVESSFMVSELILVDEKEWNELIDFLPKDSDYFEGKGGSGCIPALKKCDQQKMNTQIFRVCVVVLKGVFVGERLAGVEMGPMLIIDPERFNYARYVSLGSDYHGYFTQGEFYNDLRENVIQCLR